MANSVYLLLFAIICVQFRPSVQQRKNLQKRLNYVEVMMNSVSLKTLKMQLDISELRDAVELLNNNSEGRSLTLQDIPTLDADLETKMKKTINQQNLRITVMSKALSDEKENTRQQMEALKMSEIITIDEIKSDLMKAEAINIKLKEQVQTIASDLKGIEEINNQQKEELQDVRVDLYETKEINNQLKEQIQETTEINKILKGEPEVKEIRADLNGTNEINRQQKEELQEVKAVLTDMKSKLEHEVKESKELFELIMEMHPERFTCPDGWLKFKTTCYLYVENEEVSWDVAKTRCADQNGILAEPDTEEKMQYVLGAVTGDDDVWLGGTDNQTEGTWVWASSGRHITYFIWEPGQPNSWKGYNQDCLEVNSKGMNDERCHLKENYICEKQVSYV